MGTFLSPRSARRLISLLDGLPLPEPASVLVLGGRPGPLAEALGAAGHRVRSSADLSPQPPPAGSLDLAVVVGPLEGNPWDRWTLQRVHPLLKPSATLVFAAPNTLDLASLIDPRYVAAKLAKQARKWLPALARAGTGAPGPRGRTYTRAQAGILLEGLGFPVLRWGALGGTSLLPALCTHHVAVCRRAESLYGLGPDRPFPDADRHRRAFEAEHAAAIATRDRWASRHASRGVAAEPLDPGRYRGRAVLVLSPHPDDEIIGCGGTLLRLAAGGARVTVLQATDGSASAALEGRPEAIRRRVRLDEAEAVARAAGFEPSVLWREDNDRFLPRPELAARLRGTLDELRPSLVFTPFVTDLHADHIAVDHLLATALQGGAAPGAEVLCYEVWSRLPANTYCEVVGQMRRIEELLRTYETAMKVEDYVAHCAARNYYNALSLTGREGFVEAFFRLPADGFPALMTATHGTRPGERAGEEPPGEAPPAGAGGGHSRAGPPVR